MSSKNILIIIPYFIPAYSYGGPVKVAYDHAIGLIKNGYNVTVITSDALDAKNRNNILKETIDGIKVIRFRNLSNYAAKFLNLYLPLGLSKWLKNNIKDFNIVHIHDFFTTFTIFGAKYALQNNIKYFIQPHGVLANDSINSRKRFFKFIILSRFRDIINNSTGLLALTNVEKEDIYSIFGNDNINILRNGLCLDDFNEVKKIDLHKNFKLYSKTKIITFLGRVQYIKGIDISLKILHELNKTTKDWIFLIVGPDEGEKYNLQLLSKKLGIEDKVIWYGPEMSSKKYSLLKSSDLFLFNSRSEGFGLTILEAIASGVPVVISNNCPLPEVNKYHVGEINDNNNFVDSANKIKYVLDNKLEFLEKRSEFLKENFDIDGVVKTLIKYYNTL